MVQLFRSSALQKSLAFGCYKGFDALLVLATEDARGVFTYIHAGSPGSVGDAGVYVQTLLKRKIEHGNLAATCSWKARFGRIYAAIPCGLGFIRSPGFKSLPGLLKSGHVYRSPGFTRPSWIAQAWPGWRECLCIPSLIKVFTLIHATMHSHGQVACMGMS